MSDTDDLTPEPTGIRHSFRALRHPGFRLFWIAAIVSNSGTWLSNLAVPYVLFQITGSAIWVGLIAVAQFVPNLLMGPLGGSLADRFPRRKLLMVTQAMLAVDAFFLFALWIAGVREPWMLLVPVAIMGVLNGLNLPAWQSFVNDLVPRSDLRSAVTLNSLQFNIARSVGPAVAGVLLATLGASMAFLLNAISFGFVIAALFFIHPFQDVGGGRSDQNVLRQFVSAIRYIGTQPGIRVSIIASLIVGVAGNPIFNLTVVFAEDVFRVDALGLGILNAALGFGAIAVAPFVSGWTDRITLAQLVTWGTVTYGIALVVFGLVTSYFVGVLVLVVTGACFLAVISSCNTSLQMIVADHMRGRVMAVRIMSFTASQPIGTLAQSAIADWVGVQVSSIVAGVAMLTGFALLAFWPGAGRLRRLDDPHDESGPAVAERAA